MHACMHASLSGWPLLGHASEVGCISDPREPFIHQTPALGSVRTEPIPHSMHTCAHAGMHAMNGRPSRCMHARHCAVWQRPCRCSEVHAKAEESLTHHEPLLSYPENIHLRSAILWTLDRPCRCSSVHADVSSHTLNDSTIWRSLGSLLFHALSDAEHTNK